MVRISQKFLIFYVRRMGEWANGRIGLNRLYEGSRLKNNKPDNSIFCSFFFALKLGDNCNADTLKMSCTFAYNGDVARSLQSKMSIYLITKGLIHPGKFLVLGGNCFFQPSTLLANILQVNLSRQTTK